MAKRRVTFTVDEFSLELLQGAAARAGMSLPAWLADATRREAVRQGVGSGSGDSEAEAIAHDAELAADEAALRATG